MPLNVYDSLNEWNRSVRRKLRNRNVTGLPWLERPVAPPLPHETKRVGPCVMFTKYHSPPPEPEALVMWVVDEVRKPVSVAKSDQEAMALCQVVKFVGDEAECTVMVGEYELPRVSFPARVLRAKHLAEGGRFIWTMRDTAHIAVSDIDTGLPQLGPMLSESEQKTLDDLYEETKRQRADGGDWPEYTGPGE